LPLLVLITGISKAIMSTVVLDLVGVCCWRVRGLTTGIAAHGIEGPK
jgi:putative effector of murein hydrolase